MKELLIVGDVQGCSAELNDLLDVAQFDDSQHELAFTGDLINRGPDSRGVLELARARRALIVVGNHEDALLDDYHGETIDRVRRQLGNELERWIDWIRSWPTFIRRDDGRSGLILVHAGIAPGKRPEECTRGELTRIRNVDGRPWFESWRGPETVVFGHWAKLGKVDRPLVKGLDTGCVYGGRLSGIFWPSGKWVSVPARKMWFDPLTHEPQW
jgi:hypothetical protein